VPLWLSRRPNDMYLLTQHRPVESGGDLYIRPGDRVGINHLCRAGIAMLFGRDGLRLPKLCCMKVVVMGRRDTIVFEAEAASPE